jgi:hypothetical protein
MKKLTLVLPLMLLLVSCMNMVDAGPPDMQTLKESRPIGNTKALAVRLNYGIGSLDVRSTHAADLFNINLDYDARRISPRFDFNEGDQADLTFSTDGRHGFNGGNRRQSDLSMRLTDGVPLDLDFSTGVSESTLDLTDLDIKRIRLRGGVGKTEVSFDHPVKQPISDFEVESGVGNLTIRGLGNARVERLRVHGGVGRTELDFTGDLKDTNPDTEINVGVGQVRLLLPREAGITLEAEGSFLSNISAPSFDRQDHTYTHRGSDASVNKIRIHVRSGVGGVTVELM